MRRPEDYYDCPICGRRHVRSGTPTAKRQQRIEEGLLLFLFVGAPVLGVILGMLL